MKQYCENQLTVTHSEVRCWENFTIMGFDMDADVSLSVFQLVQLCIFGVH